MKRIIVWCAVLFLTPPCLFAQRAVEVSYKLDNQGNYIFSCLNRTYSTYVLKLEFSTLQNARPDHGLPYEAEVKPGLSKLLTLSPLDKKKDIQINYKSSYQKGCLQPTVHPDFTYLLPIAPGKEAQAYRITNAPVPGGSTAGQDSGYAIRLKMKPGDTIYAARRGVVTAVEVGSGENDAGVSVTDTWNYVEIVHGDCSYGRYGILKKDGALVKPGQVVGAGIPIGLVGGDRFGRGSDIRFSVSYYPGQPNTMISLQFWTRHNGKGTLRHGATYVSEHPKAIITQETNKPRVRKH
jgi:murein DD-endopeptidase MepM/ murein hydrolase activator NlpD